MSYITDQRGHRLSGADAASAAIYTTALDQFSLYAGDPVATADAAVAQSPGFVMAHALKAWLCLLSTEAAGIAAARETLAVAKTLPANRQETGHLQAIEDLAAGRWHAASRRMEDLSLEYPRDLLALQVGHQLDFFTGHARLLRDRITRSLPAWSMDMPGYHAVLGMHAFGLEECGQYAEAERSGRMAVELERRDGWAQHAVAHVLEMQGRHAEGVGWMTADSDAWSKDSFFAVHNWWHLALYHLEAGDIDTVLRLFDGPIYGAKSQLAIDLIDASAMLWRLELSGVNVGDRWEAVADGWEAVGGGTYAFNDVHAMMSFVGAGRPEAARTLLAQQEEALRRTDDNATFTREVGRAVTLAIRAFGDADYAETVRLLRPVRSIAHRFGGSHAQRDVLDQTLIEAALRSRQSTLAQALAAERIAAKPESPLARLFAVRAQGIA